MHAGRHMHQQYIVNLIVRIYNLKAMHIKMDLMRIIQKFSYIPFCSILAVLYFFHWNYARCYVAIVR